MLAKSAESAGGGWYEGECHWDGCTSSDATSNLQIKHTNTIPIAVSGNVGLGPRLTF